jgi:hypothetical protein
MEASHGAMVETAAVLPARPAPLAAAPRHPVRRLVPCLLHGKDPLMARYYGYVVITFLDGTTERVGGNRYSLNSEGTVLSIYTSSVGDPALRDMHNYPLAGIREYHWEGE